MLWKIEKKLGENENNLRKMYTNNHKKTLRTTILGSNFTGSYSKKSVL